MSECLQIIIERLRAMCCEPRPYGSGFRARVPGRVDNHPSLDVSVGDDGRILLIDRAGKMTFEEIMRAMGLPISAAFPNGIGIQPGRGGGPRIVETYDYLDADDRLRYQVCRRSDKTFPQRRPDGHGGHIWNLNGVQRILYHLPQLLAADPGATVFVVEGEKDVHRLEALGLIATTTSGGAGKAHLTDLTLLHERVVVIIADNDEPGRKHAEAIARTLHGHAREVHVLVFEDLPETGDVSDWFDMGHTVDDLIDAVAQSEPWPPAEPDGDTDETTDYEDDSEGSVGVGAPPEYTDFPIEVLPGPIRRFVEEVSEAMGVDPAMAALPVLTACAAAIGTTRRVRIKRSWCEPCILWTVVIARSGSVKSPAFDAALAPLRKREAGLMRDHEEALLEHDRAKKEYDAAYNQWKRTHDDGEPPPEEPIPPPPPRLVTTDPTVEALALILSENPRGLLLGRDELSGWIGSFNQFKKGGSDEAAWLELYRGGSFVVDRKTGPRTIRCDHGAVSITGTIQPAVLRRSMSGENIENGLAARLLMAHPPARLRRWTDADVSEDTELIYDHIVSQLLSLDHAADPEGSHVPVEIPLDPEARTRFIEFYNQHGAVQDRENDDAIAAALAKLEATAARLALLFHCIRVADDDVTITDPRLIDLASMEAAITVVSWFVNEARRIYATFHETEEDEAARKFFEWVVSRGGSTTPRDAVRHLARYHTTEDAKDALQDLVDRGWGRWEHPQPGPEGGRPSLQFVLVADDPVGRRRS